MAALTVASPPSPTTAIAALPTGMLIGGILAILFLPGYAKLLGVAGVGYYILGKTNIGAI